MRLPLLPNVTIAPTLRPPAKSSGIPLKPWRLPQSGFV
jgi:hypothetical protein